ncbi:hypothetical protein ACFPK9_02775 [Rubritalea spongiae]|uniref:Uncharacterized protein n=1 Tax=Rubritalea spongiae TaxID=430797 RepID=A0ABW5E1H8_9BACT
MKWIATIWGILGVTAFIGTAIIRLYEKAALAFSPAYELTTMHWIIMVAFSIFMLIAEGYRGFQKKFSPRTAARTHYLFQHSTPKRLLLAPLFCMGYFDATKKTRIIAISLTAGIICLILLMRLVPMPMRGVLDVGVVLGLSYGLLSYFCFLVKVFTKKDHGHSPEMPQ